MGGAQRMNRALFAARVLPRVGARQIQTTAVRRAEYVIPGDKAMTEHAVQATADWKKYTLMGCGFVGAVGILEFFVHLSHGHHDDLTLYPFRRVRNKPFPWGDGQTSLFGCTIDKAE